VYYQGSQQQGFAAIGNVKFKGQVFRGVQDGINSNLVIISIGKLFEVVGKVQRKSSPPIAAGEV
jgi:hypothetical protein